MPETSFSLLDRLNAASDREAWQRFVDIYSPFIRQSLRSWLLQPADADDLAQQRLREEAGGILDQNADYAD